MPITRDFKLTLLMGMVHVGTCPFCGKKNVFKLQKTLDDTQLYKCGSCGTKLIMPKEEEPEC